MAFHLSSLLKHCTSSSSPQWKSSDKLVRNLGKVSWAPLYVNDDGKVRKLFGFLATREWGNGKSKLQIFGARRHHRHSRTLPHCSKVFVQKSFKFPNGIWTWFKRIFIAKILTRTRDHFPICFSALVFMFSIHNGEKLKPFSQSKTMLRTCKMRLKRAENFCSGSRAMNGGKKIKLFPPFWLALYFEWKEDKNNERIKQIFFLDNFSMLSALAFVLESLIASVPSAEQKPSSKWALGLFMKSRRVLTLSLSLRSWFFSEKVDNFLHFFIRRTRAELRRAEHTKRTRWFNLFFSIRSIHSFSDSLIVISANFTYKTKP